MFIINIVRITVTTRLMKHKVTNEAFTFNEPVANFGGRDKIILRHGVAIPLAQLLTRTEDNTRACAQTDTPLYRQINLCQFFVSALPACSRLLKPDSFIGIPKAHSPLIHSVKTRIIIQIICRNLFSVKKSKIYGQ